MVLYIFAGPNGSGKSTIISQDIRLYRLENIEYICPDIYASKLFDNVKDVKERYLKAIRFSEYKREKLLERNQPIIVETVLSRSDKLDFVKKAKSKGYEVISVFVGTDSPEINISRVKQRVLQGGHDVPEDRLRERFVRSMNNLEYLSKLSDEIYVYDNSLKPRLVASKIKNVEFVAEDAPDWAKKI